jgi:tetratricopeptide (TPR) repeat protein
LIGVFEQAIEPAITLVDRALSLNPSFERGWRASAWLRLYAGQPDVAVEHMQTAMRLSPRFGNATDLVLIGCAHFFQRRFDDAISAYLTAREQMPKNPAIPRYLAACYAQAGRLDQASLMLEQLRMIAPVVMPSTVPFRNPEHRELFLSGLRLAAGEVT